MYPQQPLFGLSHSKYVSTHNMAGSAMRVLREGRREGGREGEREGFTKKRIGETKGRRGRKEEAVE